MSDTTPQHDPAAAAGRRLDPWIEQERRRSEYRRGRRRSFAIRLGVAVAGVAVVAAAAVFLSTGGGDDGVDADPASTPPAVRSTTVDVSTTAAPSPTTVAVEELIGIEESWLLDRGDGVYDWGVVVRTPVGASARSGVDVEVRLLASDGSVVESTRSELDGVGDVFPGVVAGRTVDPEPVPNRLEFDVVVGTESAALSLGEMLDLRAIEREGDQLTGRVRVMSGETVEDVGVVFVWRGDAGEVVAAVPLAIDRVRPGVDARFELDLDLEEVPDGAPDDAFWTP